ncbi:hypothetical protein ACFFTM_24170 [Pseudoduganella plicata]|uniref:Twin-arginine translocation signal domain-containing protein n=1 Tax=Pseudoduganella plicata TaxID=321984 RepID=A0A4P7BFB2_9BURK|nr:hypothetical protein [Pseudoduganella plicata]QBQ37344.1 hypothetical protein E1742_15110 [Pseudoduganella plicata]GGZ09015.1 hypothetical protein GCM10007388_48170 [Pseudoduganella plicata]
MVTPIPPDPTAEPAPMPPAPLSQQGLSRRRFTRAGAVASGVLLTLHGQPGMAAEVCTTASGSLSGGLQSFRGAKPVCSGRSPGYWKNSSWPGGCDKSMPFSRVFACDARNYKSYGSVSLSAILVPKSFDKFGIGRHLVACWLNVKGGLSTFQTERQLQAIWNEYQASGFYTPTAGVRWDGGRIAEYLQSTFD